MDLACKHTPFEKLTAAKRLAPILVFGVSLCMLLQPVSVFAARPCADVFSTSAQKLLPDNFGPLDIVGVKQVFQLHEGREPTSSEVQQLDFLHHFGENAAGAAEGTFAESHNFTLEQIQDKYRGARGGKISETLELALQSSNQNLSLRVKPETAKALLRQGFLGGKSSKNKKKDQQKARQQKKLRESRLKEARQKKQKDKSQATDVQSSENSDSALRPQDVFNDSFEYYPQFQKLSAANQQAVKVKFAMALDLHQSLYDSTKSRWLLDNFSAVKLEFLQFMFKDFDNKHIPKNRNLKKKGRLFYVSKSAVEKSLTGKGKETRLSIDMTLAQRVKHSTEVVIGNLELLAENQAFWGGGIKGLDPALANRFNWLVRFAKSQSEFIVWQDALSSIQHSESLHKEQMIPWLALLSSRAGVDLNAPLDRALSSTELGLSVAYKTSILLLASENQTVRELHGERIFSWLKRVKSEGDRDAALLLQYLYEPTDIVLEKLVSDSKNQYFDLGLSSQPAAFFANEQFFEVAFKAQRFDLLEQWHRFHVEAFPENSLEHAQKILSRGHMLISAIVSQNTVQSSRALSLVERLQKTSPEAFDHPVWREALGGLHIAEVPETLQLQFFETVPPMTGLVQLIDGINGGHIPFALREQVAEIIADRMPQDTLERGLLPNAAHLGLLKILYSQKHNALDGLLVRMSVTHGIDHEALLDVVVRNVHTEDHGPMFHELSQKVSSNEAASLVDSYRRTQYFEKVFEIFEGRLSSKAKSELFLIQYFDGIVRLKNNRWMKIASSPEVSRHLLEMLQVQSLSNTKFFELTDALERAGCLESSSSEQNFADLRASLKQARADRKKARLEAYSKKSDTSKKRKARDPQFESTETTLENKSSAGFQADMQKLESVAHVLREAVRDENLSGLDQAISGLDQVTATDLAEAKKEHRENLIKAVTAAVRVCAKEQHYVGAYKWAFEALKNKDTNELNAEVLAEWLAPIRAFFKKVRDVRPYLDGLAELQMHADGRVSAEMAELLHVYVQKDIDAAMQLSGPPIHMQKLHKLFEVSKDNADQKKLGAVYAAELLPYLSKVHADIADFARDAIEDQSKDLGEFLSARLAKRLKDYDGRIAKDAPPELSARSVAPESLWSGFTVGRGKDFSAKTSELFDRFFGSELVERADQDLRDALELAGMEAIFRREIEIGRVPIDMSQTHAGFDILSIDFAQGKIYCLEAKAKLVGSKHFDQITLTHHEMRVSKNISLSAQDSVFYQVEIIDVAPRGGKNGRVLDVYTLRRVELDPYDSNLIVPDSLADKNARYDRKKLIEAFGTEPFFWPSL